MIILEVILGLFDKKERKALILGVGLFLLVLAVFYGLDIWMTQDND